ncbi:hypothetical protein BJ508DRAFT_48270 [Ascobolus immersus RN42]|uniref:Uncharacterized protein n=1 Tax=Ascobolus immersus RN42 TaxID=1160509 RepID=A0A3N4HHY9_ASCIM|nr:hypothetical protein BJ508DRAFT_48270 [Ascobolus immersus RN42]
MKLLSDSLTPEHAALSVFFVLALSQLYFASAFAIDLLDIQPIAELPQAVSTTVEAPSETIVGMPTSSPTTNSTISVAHTLNATCLPNDNGNTSVAILLDYFTSLCQTYNNSVDITNYTRTALNYPEKLRLDVACYKPDEVDLSGVGASRDANKGGDAKKVFHSQYKVVDKATYGAAIALGVLFPIALIVLAIVGWKRIEKLKKNCTCGGIAKKEAA